MSLSLSLACTCSAVINCYVLLLAYRKQKTHTQHIVVKSENCGRGR